MQTKIWSYGITKPLFARLLTLIGGIEMASTNNLAWAAKTSGNAPENLKNGSASLCRHRR